MGRKNIRLETYVDASLHDAIESAVEKSGMSKSELLREGAKRQVQQMSDIND